MTVADGDDRSRQQTGDSISPARSCPRPPVWNTNPISRRMIRHRNIRILNRSPPLRALPSRANHCRDLPPAISRAVCLWDGVVWGQLPRRACLGHPDDLARLVPASRGLIALGLRSRERPLSRVHAECRVQFNVLLHLSPFPRRHSRSAHRRACHIVLHVRLMMTTAATTEERL